MKKLLSVLLFTTVVFSVIPITASAKNEKNIQTEPQAIYQSADATKPVPYFSLVLSGYENRYLPNESIELSFSATPFVRIVDFNYQSTGFTEVDISINNNENIINVELCCSPSQSECVFQINAQLESGDSVSSFAYAVSNEHGTFISPYSIDNARERYLAYALDENIINQVEFEKIWQDHSRVSADSQLLNEVNSLDIDMEHIAGDASISSTGNSLGAINGYINWKDDNGNDHELRKVKVEAYRKGAIIDTKINTTYTDGNGYYIMDVTAGDNIYLKIYAGDSNVMVRSGILFVDYYCTYDNEKSYISVSPGTIHYIPNIVIDMDSDAGKAIQISQAVITARDYAKEMMGKTPQNVTVVYPHDGEIEDTFDSNNTNGCFYNTILKTINITGRHPNASDTTHYLPHTYASWDVIMHEYGHHIQAELDIADSPTGGHISTSSMAEHYKKHYLDCDFINCTITSGCILKNALNLPSLVVLDNECKYEGCAISWAEAWATIFGNMAQEYYSNDLSNIAFVNDAKYTSYNGSDYSIESTRTISSNYLAEDVEGLIICLLYDLYDNSNNESFDAVSFSYQEMWDCFVNSEAKTIFEFIEYLKGYKNNINTSSKIGKLLNEYNLSTSAPTISSFDFEAPTVEFIWDEPNENGFYKARKFSVNFYNYTYNPIGRTIPQEVTFDSSGKGSILVDEELWQSVLELDSIFYISITMGEYDGNINNLGDDYFITEYESEFVLYSISNLYQKLSYTSQIIKTLDVGDYYWFKFTAPLTEEYVFETVGTTDTYGELFYALAIGTSINNRLDANDDAGEGNNFKITYSLSKGDTVYLRIGGYNWIKTGEFTLKVSSTNHVHNYTYSYTKNNLSSHKAFCCCGASIYESHDFYFDLTKRKCRECGYEAIDFGPILKESIENDILNFYNEIYYIPNEENE